MGKADILLNHVFLKNRIAELGIKQWWLAERVGVDRKTVIRWVQGQVRSIHQENIERLAAVLDCEVDQLSHSSGLEQLATVQDQKEAAALLIKSSLIDKLGPIGEWNVIESLLRATIVPNLPLNVLGEVYNQLTIASWRQSKIDQATEYNAKTEELARRANDKGLLTSALLSKANIFSWRGQTSRSLKTYEECIGLGKYMGSRSLGSALSNYGAVLYEAGDLDRGEASIRKSLEVFRENGTPTNFSIAHCHLAMIYLQKGQVDQASFEVEASIEQANQGDYRRGQQMGKLIQAEIESRCSNAARALALLDSALEEFRKLGICDGLNLEYAGRVHRYLGSFDEAADYLDHGIQLSQEFPVYLAALWAERARLLQAQGSATWSEAAETALGVYHKAECPLRVQMIKKEFGIQ